jgi:hypothetical protein
MTTRTIRGQSSIDFVIGFGVFFLTFSFVILLLPELLSPFSGPQETVVADRAAGTLTGDLLASGTVGVLNQTCTAEFLTGSGSTCSFGGTSTTALVGISDEHTVNVSLEQNVSSGPETEVVCYNGTAIQECASGGDTLARGAPPPADTKSVRTASRVVTVAGETLYLRVRVW